MGRILLTVLALLVIVGCKRDKPIDLVDKQLEILKMIQCNLSGIIAVERTGVSQTWIEQNQGYAPDTIPDFPSDCHNPIYIDLGKLPQMTSREFSDWWKAIDEHICMAPDYMSLSCMHFLSDIQRQELGSITVKTKTIGDFKIMLQNQGLDLDTEMYKNYARFYFSYFGRVKVKSESEFSVDENLHSIPFLHSITRTDVENPPVEIGFFKVKFPQVEKILIRIKRENGRLEYYNFSDNPTAQ
ncbi:hypothetical protein [Flavobacterium pallidum]|uniref:Lipoprotein n=1 Tax=Flavobacterium pallidum TaxID=2172098 RepID=A0A2S1SHH2_9FLAO|nr:hypothetical protein [Flavobacterium pallidum]AWI25792.1 hypothetical protein HYN49_07690 [Flavobacterium pallidum]